MLHCRLTVRPSATPSRTRGLLCSSRPLCTAGTPRSVRVPVVELRKLISALYVISPDSESQRVPFLAFASPALRRLVAHIYSRPYEQQLSLQQ